MRTDRLTAKSLLGSVAVCLVSGFFLGGCAQQDRLNVGEWTLNYDKASKGIDIKKGTRLVGDDVYASYRLSDTLVSTRAYAANEIATEKIEDAFGKGLRYKITYTDDHLPTLVHSFYVYPDKDYVLTDFYIEDASGVASNYMAPIHIDRMPKVLTEGNDHRVLFVPFDNDCWIRYQSHSLSSDSFSGLNSYEVTVLFDNDTRQAIVTGSVEHDTWKTGITVSKDSIHNVGSLKCYGGIADRTTRDSKPHGTVRGTQIKSPKILLGYFEDWREGLEEYARANAVVAPPKTWSKAVPFGWNSWGALQFNLTYQKAIEVSDFYRRHLQNHAFANADSLVYIGLDSGWNSFTEDELKNFADKCRANGQVPGIYWTPFTDWGKNPEREIKEAPGYKYKDVYLYANGQPQELDGAYALDPTHPAVESMMKATSELFHRTGFEYVKMDFMTHGAMEADRWHNPDIQTGIQGYNYGMKLIDKYFGDMYINLSISPIFPAHYAQSRRIACDAWNKMKDTEYTMNALSYGWWQDEVYRFNDPDHIVLREATDGENRARVTSGVITGLFICGDDFSVTGPAADKEKAMKYLTNAAVNAIATGESFRPVEGNGEKSENQFVRIDKDGKAYYAVFNYGEQELKMPVSLERIGLNPEKEYRMTELWSGTESRVKNRTEVIVPAQDVVLFRLEE